MTSWIASLCGNVLDVGPLAVNGLLLAFHINLFWFIIIIITITIIITHL